MGMNFLCYVVKNDNKKLEIATNIDWSELQLHEQAWGPYEFRVKTRSVHRLINDSGSSLVYVHDASRSSCWIKADPNNEYDALTISFFKKTLGTPARLAEFCVKNRWAIRDGATAALNEAGANKLKEEIWKIDKCRVNSLRALRREHDEKMEHIRRVYLTQDGFRAIYKFKVNREADDYIKKQRLVQNDCDNSIEEAFLLVLINPKNRTKIWRR